MHIRAATTVSRSSASLVCQVCFRRNVHGRQLAELQAAARAWEPAPPAFPLLDVAGLLQGEARALYPNF